jgi:hypothetical protein
MAGQGEYDTRTADLVSQEQICRQETSPVGQLKDTRGAWNTYLQGVSEQPMDPLKDLTSSQRKYIENLRAIEKANPKAKPTDIAMAISLVLWGGRIWEQDGKAADVATPGGAPLVLDYAGGKGYEDVKVSDAQKQLLRQQREVHDTKGKESGVAHAFPAVAAQAGRTGTTTGSYNSFMVTTGGDFIQDVARVIVEQNTNVFRDAEKRDNERALQVAEEIGDSDLALSVALTERFRAENGGGAS